MIAAKHSLVWPASPDDPTASTLLTVDDLIEGGGADAMRRYIAERLTIAAQDEPAAPACWAAFAKVHLHERVGDLTDGGIEVGCGAVQMILAYVAHLEAAVGQGAIQ